MTQLKVLAAAWLQREAAKLSVTKGNFLCIGSALAACLLSSIQLNAVTTYYADPSTLIPSHSKLCQPVGPLSLLDFIPVLAHWARYFTSRSIVQDEITVGTDARCAGKISQVDDIGAVNWVKVML